MMEQLKQTLYFPIAWYFRFFASIRLMRWRPRIVVVTGSNGKTTLFNLLESQIGDRAKFSHHANSSYGIPFDILDLHRKTLQIAEWFTLILQTPLLAFKSPPKEKIYVVEADTDRPGEGKFLAEFLKPEVVLFVSVGTTHSMNFDQLVGQKQFPNVEEAIAYDYGYFLEYCSKLAIINGDQPLITKQKARTKAEVKEITKKEYLDEYEISKESILFKINKKKYTFSALLPQEIFYALAMCREVVEYLHLGFDDSFAKFTLPPGRGSIFPGIKKTTIIDSSYNSNLGSASATLSMFERFPAKKKWVVLADMLELGDEEQEEHERLAEILAKMDLQKIILFGPAMKKYTEAKLQAILKDSDNVQAFITLREVNDFIHKHLSGGETILFKGSQSMMLESVIEQLLEDKTDAAKLPRRQKFWVEKRQRLGLQILD